MWIQYGSGSTTLRAGIHKIPYKLYEPDASVMSGFRWVRVLTFPSAKWGLPPNIQKKISHRKGKNRIEHKGGTGISFDVRNTVT